MFCRPCGGGRGGGWSPGNVRKGTASLQTQARETIWKKEKLPHSQAVIQSPAEIGPPVNKWQRSLRGRSARRGAEEGSRSP